jgi:hypothetical protein
MADNAQKTPFFRSMNRFAEAKAISAIQLLGKALPCSVVAVSGSIVKVKFELNAAPYTLPNVTVPLAGPEWIRYPTQIGDKGIVIPSDVRIGGITGLGSGVANLNLPANLSALTFFPIGNANWDATDDAQKVVIYGPNGVIIRTTDSSTKLELSPTGVAINNDFSASGDVSLGGGAKRVVLDGDPVIGGGGGTVQASSTKVMAT